MRLPQSSTAPLSIRVFSFTIFIAAAVVLPLSARSAAQQLQCAPTHLKFGAVTVGQVEKQVVVLSNTGNTSVTVSAIGVSTAEFSVSGVKLPLALAAGQSVSLSVVFSPTVTGYTNGKATFTSNASDPGLQLGFGGTGVSSEAVSAAPSSLSFGQMAVGTSATRTVVLTNNRTWKEVLQGIQLVGSFSVSGATFPLALSPGQRVTLSVTYAPLVAGPTGGSLFVSGPVLNIPLTGTGTRTTIGELAISPTALNFGSVLIGETDTQAAVLTAAGGSVTISSAASSNAQFSLPGATFPLTIAAGQSVQFNVAFRPQKSGTASAKLSFSSNASDPLDTEPVAGTGTAPQVSLAWSPSTSQVQGYNVYRGAAPGKYSKINSSLDPNTAYTDATVASGTTYYYAATAVNSSGQESTYSSPVEVTVP